MSILERIKGTKAAAMGRAILEGQQLRAAEVVEAKAIKANAALAAVAERETAVADVLKQDVAEVSSEHARITSDLGRVDLLEGDAGSDLLLAVENLVVALDAFDRELPAKFGKVHALDDRARELVDHLRREHGVHVVGAGTTLTHLNVAEAAAWKSAVAKLSDAAKAAFLEHGLGNPHRTKAVLDTIALAMNHVEVQARAKRIAGNGGR